jgi:hypothetical protein
MPLSQLLAESRVLNISPLGTVAEISFQGTHEWTHGREMQRYLDNVMAEIRPAAIIFNLLDYRYACGNDVTTLFVAAYDHEAKKLRPVYIAATGETYTSLLNLFKQGKIQEAFDVKFVDSVEEAVERLQQIGDDSV